MSAEKFLPEGNLAMAWTGDTETGFDFVIDGKNRRMPVELTGLWLVKWLPIDGITNSSYSCKIIGRILPANSLFNNKQIDLGCSLSVWE